MSRDILAGFDAAGIGIASATYDIVGLPPVRLAAGKVGGSIRAECSVRSPPAGSITDGGTQSRTRASPITRVSRRESVWNPATGRTMYWTVGCRPQPGTMRACTCLQAISEETDRIGLFCEPPHVPVEGRGRARDPGVGDSAAEVSKGGWAPSR